MEQTEIKNRLRERIKDYAQLKKMTEEQATEHVLSRMGWTKNKLSYLLNNTVQPSFIDLYALCKVLECPIDALYKEVTTKPIS